MPKNEEYAKKLIATAKILSEKGKEITDLFVSGESKTAVAKAYGISIGAVDSALYKNGHPEAVSASYRLNHEELKTRRAGIENILQKQDAVLRDEVFRLRQTVRLQSKIIEERNATILKLGAPDKKTVNTSATPDQIADAIIVLTKRLEEALVGQQDVNKRIKELTEENNRLKAADKLRAERATRHIAIGIEKEFSDNINEGGDRP